MDCQRPLQPLDIVCWVRDGGGYSGVVRDIHGEIASILTGHGPVQARTADLTVIFPSEHWDPDALADHLWAAYGVRLR